MYGVVPYSLYLDRAGIPTSIEIFDQLSTSRVRSDLVLVLALPMLHSFQQDISVSCIYVVLLEWAGPGVMASHT